MNHTSHRPTVFPTLRLLVGGALVLLAGCQSTLQRSDSWVSRLTPYKAEVVQGNVVTQEQAAELKVGLTRLQVRDILGTPLVHDLFHTNRWDYVFTIVRPGVKNTRHALTLHFDGEALAQIQTAELPSERAFVESIDTEKFSGKAPVLSLSAGDIAAHAAQVAKATPPGGAAANPSLAASAAAPRDFPPLEP